MGSNQTKDITETKPTTEEPKPVEESTSTTEKPKTEKPSTNILEKPKFEDTPGVDLCFMLDCTGSMMSYIQMSCRKIKDIIDQVKQTYPCSEVRVGIVGYRDVQDANRFDILPFTYSADTAKEFLDTLGADGGGDTPEDVNGAFQKTLFTMEWKMPVKIVVHIADAPCHGKDFHSCDDNHPKGYKEDLAWDKIFKDLVEKRIDYMFLKIMDQTDKMFEKFKALAEKHGATKAEITFEQELSLYDEQKKAPVVRSCGLSRGEMERRSLEDALEDTLNRSYHLAPMSETVNAKVDSLFAEKVACKVKNTVSREMKRK